MTKVFALMPVPDSVVTLMGPVEAPVGTTALICVGAVTEKLAALVPLNFTDVAPEKFRPSIEISVPETPMAGEKSEMNGSEPVMIKLFVLVPVPANVETLIGPEAAPVGTVAWI